MKYLALLASIFILYIVGQIIVSYFAFFGLAPNLLLLLLIILAFDEKSLNFLFIAIVGGLLLDFASGFPIGAYLLSFLVLGLVLHIVSSRMHILGFGYRVLPVIITLSVLITNAWLYIYLFLSGVFKLTPFTLSVQILSRNILWQVLYNLLLFLPVYGFSLVLQNVLLRIDQRKKGASLL
jgi:rod shape-determining protein MreD